MKLNLSLPRSLRVRLGAYAEFRETTISELVTAWAAAALKGFSVSQRPEGDRSSGDGSAQASAEGPGLRVTG